MKLNKSKNKKGRIDFQLLCAIILILCVGVVMVYSSSSYYALHIEESVEFFLKKELTWTVVGILAMIVTMSIDYHNYKKFTLFGIVVTLILLVAVLFQKGVNGASRWIPLPGGASFQPSELAKYVVVAFMAMSIDARKRKMNGFFSGTIFYLFVSGVFAALILLQPNLSIASIIMIVTFIMILVGGANIKHIASLIPPVLIGGVILIFSEDYRRNRFLGFLDPWADTTGKSFQLIQSFYALGTGGLTGVGLGQSTQKALYMPEPYNDFIFAIIGEEFGLFGCLFVMALFLFLIFRGMSVAIKAKDNYGFLLGTGIISIIAVQAMVNIAVVTGSMPVTGVPLPFISYGGTSLVFNLAAMGVLLNISRQGKKVEI